MPVKHTAKQHPFFSVNYLTIFLRVNNRLNVKKLQMELFYLTAVPQLTLELRPVLTSLPYLKPFRVDLVGGGIMTSRKEAKTLFAALLQRALSFLYLPPYFHYIFSLPSGPGSVLRSSFAAHLIALPAKSNLLTIF